MRKATIILIAAMSVLTTSCRFTDSLKVRLYVNRYVKSTYDVRLKSFKYTPNDTVYTYNAGKKLLDSAVAELEQAHRLLRSAETCKAIYEITGSAAQLRLGKYYSEMCNVHIAMAKAMSDKAISLPPETHILNTATVTYIDEYGEKCSEKYVIDSRSLTVKCPVSEYGTTENELFTKI